MEFFHRQFLLPVMKSTSIARKQGRCVVLATIEPPSKGDVDSNNFVERFSSSRMVKLLFGASMGPGVLCRHCGCKNVLALYIWC